MKSTALDRFGVPAAALLLIVALAGLSEPQPAPKPAPACPGPDCPAPTPTPTPAPTPQPEPKPAPKPNTPKPPRKPWGPREDRSVGAVSIHGFKSDGPIHDGNEVQVDLPADILKANIASKGLGCCVFRSINYAGLWQNQPEVWDLPEKMKEAGIEGGGWPQKVDQIMKKFAPNTPYMQVENGDWSIVELALKTGRLPAITHVPGHMVSLPCLGNGVGAFRDNNHTGPTELIWGTEEEIKHKAGGSRFWSVILLAPRPPAPPKNRTRAAIGAELCRQFIAPPIAGRWEWREFDHRTEWALWCEGRQRGNFSVAQDCYREFEDGRWGRAWKRPPVPLPEQVKVWQEAMPPGVYADHSPTLSTGRERYSLCGQEISRGQAQAALVDDSGYCSLTIIGPDADRKRVLADLAAPEFADFKARVLVQDYDPSNWAISTERYGFVTTGAPTIYLQAPDGTELARVDRYEGRATLEGLRKKHPDYNPSPSPDAPHINPLIPTPDGATGGVSVALAIAMLGAIVGVGLGHSEPLEEVEAV